MAYFGILWWENRIPYLLTLPLIPIPWLMIPNPRCCDPWSYPIVVMSENRTPNLLTVLLIPIPWLMIPNPRCCDPWSHPILCCRSLISYVSLQLCNRYTTQGLPEVSLPLEIGAWGEILKMYARKSRLDLWRYCKLGRSAVGMLPQKIFQISGLRNAISCVFRRKFSVNKYEGKRNS